MSIVGADKIARMLLFIAYTADHHGEPTASMEVAELAWVTSADGNLVTDAGRQLMTTLVQLDLIDEPHPVTHAVAPTR